MCMSLGLPLSFDPHRHQCVLEIHHLLLQSEDVEPLQETSLLLYYVFEIGMLKSELICAGGSTYWVCLFVCLFFFLR